MKALLEKEAEDFLEKNGFDIIERALVSNKEDILRIIKKFGFPLVMKITSKLHKTDFDGVKISNNEREAVEYFKLLNKVSETILVQKYIKGHELLLGLKKDETFGHAVSVGLGGIYTEIFKDVSFRICPINKEDAEEMIKELKIYSILKGARGNNIDIKVIENMLIKLSKLPEKYEEIEELDINPLIINEKEAKIVDARIIFS